MPQRYVALPFLLPSMLLTPRPTRPTSMAGPSRISPYRFDVKWHWSYVGKDDHFVGKHAPCICLPEHDQYQRHDRGEDRPESFPENGVAVVIFDCHGDLVFGEELDTADAGHQHYSGWMPLSQLKNCKTVKAD